MKLSLQITKLAQLLKSFNISFLPRTAVTDENKHESCWQLRIKENPTEETLAKNQMESFILS